MKRPWAFICANEGATSKHLRNYCREVYLLGYLPVCPKLQDSQYLVLEDAVERSEYTAIVRDKLLRCPMLVVCSRNQERPPMRRSAWRRNTTVLSQPWTV